MSFAMATSPSGALACSRTFEPPATANFLPWAESFSGRRQPAATRRAWRSPPAVFSVVQAPDEFAVSPCGPRQTSGVLPAGNSAGAGCGAATCSSAPRGYARWKTPPGPNWHNALYAMTSPRTLRVGSCIVPTTGRRCACMHSFMWTCKFRRGQSCVFGFCLDECYPNIVRTSTNS